MPHTIPPRSSVTSPVPTETMGPIPPYVVDANSWIEGFNVWYRPNAFTGVWADMDRWLRDGTVVLIQKTYLETTRHDNALKKWMYSKVHFVRANTLSAESLYGSIIADPMGQALIAKAQNRSDGDARVIAAAWDLRGTVVSEEFPSTRPSRPGIPNVCDRFNVPCIRFGEMIARLGVQYSASSLPGA